MQNFNEIIESLQHIQKTDFPKKDKLSDVVNILKDVKISYEDAYANKCYVNLEPGRCEYQFLKIKHIYTKKDDYGSDLKVYITGTLFSRDTWTHKTYKVNYYKDNWLCSLSEFNKKWKEIEPESADAEKFNEIWNEIKNLEL